MKVNITIAIESSSRLEFYQTGTLQSSSLNSALHARIMASSISGPTKTVHTTPSNPNSNTRLCMHARNAFNHKSGALYMSRDTALAKDTHCTHRAKHATHNMYHLQKNLCTIQAPRQTGRGRA